MFLEKNLQLFAEGADEANEKEDETATDQQAEEGERKDAKYTDADIDRIIGKKFAEWQKKQEKAVDEAKKLGEMNAQQKAEYERDQLEQRVQELIKKDALAEMSKQARSMLSEKGINIGDDLLAALISEDADETKQTVESFTELFQSEVKKSVAEALKGNVPKTGTASGITKEDIMKVKNRAERQRLIKENRELFN